MKRLVLLGEGHGETSALPALARKIIEEKGQRDVLFVNVDVIRPRNALGLVKSDRSTNKTDYSKWLHYLEIAARRPNLAGVLAIFDGDANTFPAGSGSPFCAATAAQSMAKAAEEIGAGRIFSLAVVFACVEYESWIIAGAESLAGKALKDGRHALPPGTRFPSGNPEAHGKTWLERNCPGYRPTRDQRALTELLDIATVRAKGLRSFTRLENAFDQIINAVARGSHVSSPF